MQSFDPRKSLTVLDQDSTLIVVVEMSLSGWLVAGLVPGVSRQPLKQLDADPDALLALLMRWRAEAEKAGHAIERVTLAYEAGRDGFWLARWLKGRGIEAHVMHPTSIAVPREHRRAKSDRLDCGLLTRAFLGWLRGEIKHCSMAAIPSIAEEDAKRSNRDHQSLVGERTRLLNRLQASLIRWGIRDFNGRGRKAEERLGTLLTPEGASLPANSLAELRRDLARLKLIKEQIAAIEAERQAGLKAAPECRSNAAMRLLSRIIGLGAETADVVANELLSRGFHGRRAVARYAGLTGAPDESGAKRRDKGLSRSGNMRVRRAMIQFAWRFVRFQADSPLAQWFTARTQDKRKDGRKRMIVALARKLTVALWRLATQGILPHGIAMRGA